VLNGQEATIVVGGPAVTVISGCETMATVPLINPLIVRTPATVDWALAVATPATSVTPTGPVIVIAAPLDTSSATVAPLTAFPKASRAVAVTVLPVLPAATVTGLTASVEVVADGAAADTVTPGCCATVTAPPIVAAIVRAPATVDVTDPVTVPSVAVAVAGCVIVIAAPLAIESVTVTPATGVFEASRTVTVTTAGPPPAITAPGATTTEVLAALDAPLNSALTARAVDRLTTQLPVPLQSPPHPPKLDPADGTAVSVTAVASGNGALQVPDAMPAPSEQAIPAGVLETVPAPAPEPVTVSGRNGTKFAFATSAAEAARMHVGATPLHAPLHPAKDEPIAALGVSVIVAPSTKLATQFPLVAPATTLQLIPSGALLTDPLPAPKAATVTERNARKRACTARGVFAVTVQPGRAPVQSPLHPAKALWLPGAAVSVIAVPFAKLAVQLPLGTPVATLHAIPAGALVTAPTPLPAPDTVSSSGAAEKFACTLTVALIVNGQAIAVPEQAPLHPEKTLPFAAVAVSVIVDPAVYSARQVPLLFAPAIVHDRSPVEPVTVPVPAPVPERLTW
jgi:hypothetical protein